MPCVDLEGSASKTQKTEFYKAQWAKFDPFFSNLGLFKAKSRSNLPLYRSDRAIDCFSFVLYFTGNKV